MRGGTMRTGAAVLLLLCGLGGLARAVGEEDCETHQLTSDGQCCEQCPPGEGVEKECGATQTVCAQCLDSETYSENYSAAEQCKPCTECTGLMRMQTPCTDSNDATCVCDYNFFLSELSGRCEPCTVCPAGEGVLQHCEYDRDTACETCSDDTYSDRDSSLDPCLPCTMCEEATEKEVAACTPLGDSVCHNPLFPTYPPTTFDLGISPPSFGDEHPSPPDDDSSSPSPGETTTAGPGSPRFLGPHGINENLIPVYCSILAAVVVGLVAYIVFKRWNSCKQNKQPANNRAAAANQTVSPEGEKLHSDSGISVDSQSLQEQQAHAHGLASRSHTQEHIVVRVDGGPQPDSPPPPRSERRAEEEEEEEEEDEEERKVWSGGSAERMQISDYHRDPPKR